VLEEVCTFLPQRAQAPGPMPKETVMRFYNQAHAFYCGAARMPQKATCLARAGLLDV
jgi:hypothetical protein